MGREEAAALHQQAGRQMCGLVGELVGEGAARADELASELVGGREAVAWMVLGGGGGAMAVIFTH